ncbi:endoribonuclease ZC3H12A-like [Phlebotomus argentipes]|uniref:endoribonuclease ZC3H12A-like n=1 Tax=Phlebotomus argentipes TaxID=94469 RepID=UPI0028931808|nr:endoribonuclease ZC3H12A-like [Phlebotomus argentipes]
MLKALLSIFNVVRIGKTNGKRQNDADSSGNRKMARMYIIDGTDVAMTYGEGRIFSVRGIQIALNKYADMNCEVYAIVPQKTMKKIFTDNHTLIHALQKSGKVFCAPGKNLPNGSITECNPQRFILDIAIQYDAVILSNSDFERVSDEKTEWRQLIQHGRLQRYKFDGDNIILL